MKAFGIRAIFSAFFVIVVAAAPLRIVDSLPPLVTTTEGNGSSIESAPATAGYVRNFHGRLLKPSASIDVLEAQMVTVNSNLNDSDRKWATNIEQKRRSRKNKRATTGSTASAVTQTASSSVRTVAVGSTAAGIAKVPLYRKLSLWAVKNATKKLMKIAMTKLWKFISDRFG